MSDDKIKALEARVDSLEAELSALYKVLGIIVSEQARNDGKRARFAERIRTIGDRPGLESEAARALIEDIADRIDTLGTPPPEDG